MPAAAAVFKGAGNVYGLVGAHQKGKAAKAQAAAMDRRRNELIELTKPTAQELRQQSELIRTQEQAIGRQEKILEAINPGIIEAGKQAYDLLQGKEAGIVNVARNQRNRARAQLENRLRDRFGSDYETSTAGAQALAEFDSQTQDQLQLAQNQALGTLSNYSTMMGRESRGYEEGIRTAGITAFDASGKLRQQQFQQRAALEEMFMGQATPDAARYAARAGMWAQKAQNANEMAGMFSGGGMFGGSSTGAGAGGGMGGGQAGGGSPADLQKFGSFA